MSSLGSARNVPPATRRSVATASARPRVPSSRVGATDSPELGSELGPQDSASNAPSRKITLTSVRTNGSHRSLEGKRTERTHITTEDTFQIRTRRKMKPAAEDRESNVSKATGERKDQRTAKAVDDHSTRPRNRKEAIPQWNPKATLVAHTSAPLATRVSAPPLSLQLPDALQPQPLNQLSSELQELALVEDLLFAFMGYEGQYIRFANFYNPMVEKDRLIGPNFTILPGLDPSLRDLATTMLKMATHYCAVEAFVEVQSREEFGMINHALCSSMRKLLKEYLTLIAQLENQLITNASFTLHVLHLQILPTMHKMFQLYTLGQEVLRKNSLLEDDLEDSVDDFDVDNLLEQLREGGDLVPGSTSLKIRKGGTVLRHLTERLSFMSGDPAARDLLQGLLQDASRPYMTMLNEWLHHGGIKDPHAEFLVREQQSIGRDRLDEDFTDQYWDKRYTIRDTDIPPQLEAVKEKVLLAGKYLNVVRECGGVDIGIEVKDVPKSFDDPRFLDNVHGAYAHANSALMKLLVTTHALPARLRSMKHYFFLDHSDFFSYFLFLGDSELKKPAKIVNESKLQSLLDLVLRQPGSVAAQDPYQEDVKVNMSNWPLTKFLMSVVSVKGYEQDEADELMSQSRTSLTQATQAAEEDDNRMTGFQALEFKYSVPFPVSLVISSKTVVRYQIIFRYILSMRHLESLIVKSWEDHTKVMSWTHKSSDRKLELWKRRSWTLRARMLSFVQQFIYYCTSEVIEPNWNMLMEKVNGSADGRTQKLRDGQPRLNRTVDELMLDHVDFLDTCLKELMLINARLLRIQGKIVNVCTLFTIYTTSMSRTLCSADASLAGTPATLSYLSREYPSPRHPIPERLKTFDADLMVRMEDMLGKYEENFNRHLDIFLGALDYYAATENVALGKLCAGLSMASEKGGAGGEGKGAR